MVALTMQSILSFPMAKLNKQTNNKTEQGEKKPNWEQNQFCVKIHYCYEQKNLSLLPVQNTIMHMFIISVHLCYTTIYSWLIQENKLIFLDCGLLPFAHTSPWKTVISVFSFLYILINMQKNLQVELYIKLHVLYFCSFLI